MLHAHVLLCRVTSHSSALQVEETGPLVRGEQQKRGGKGGVKKRCCPAHRRDAWHWLCPRCQQASGKWAAVVVVVVSSGSAQQLQRRVLTDMRKGKVLEEGRCAPL